MGPSDRPRLLPDGAACTACGAPVPTGRIRILARRDDLAFVELACPDCGSAAIGLLVPAASGAGSAVLDVAADAPAAGPAPGRAPARSITEADVAAVRADLAAWDGDLVGWLDAIERGGSTVDR
ncbi:MAG TPA: hypothetical protein VGQ31_12915 [Candidatus Limnocylindrales bacterium]|jgi:predicted RNA-binding Zn-ribbon protein involved in translation (DUF1610 family)|nr:hypothetical protein [Candidatus Limnocylindrales bacterium]